MSYKLFAQRVGLIGLANLLISLNGLIFLPILTKNLSIGEYGIWNQVLVTIGLIPSLLVLGLSGAMTRFLAAKKRKEEIREDFYSILFFVLFISIIAAIIIASLSNLLAKYIFEKKMIVIILALLIILCPIMIVCTTYFRTFQYIKKYVFFVIFDSYGVVALAILVIFLGYKLEGVIFSLLITKVIGLFIMLYIIISDIGVVFPKFLRIKEFLNFGLPTVLGSVAFWIVNSSDKYVIGLFLDSKAVGYYSIGYMLTNVFLVYSAPFSSLLPPVLSKLYEVNKIEKVKIYLSYSLKYLLMISIPSAFGLTILSKNILTIISTAENALNSYKVVPFVAIGMLFFGIQAIISNILRLVKKTKIIRNIWVIAATLNLGLNIIFVPYFGYIAAAITTLVAYLVAFLISIYYSRKYLRFYIGIKFILKSILASIIMSTIILKLTPSNIWMGILTVMLGALTYFIVLFLLRSFKEEEIIFLRELFSI